MLYDGDVTEDTGQPLEHVPGFWSVVSNDCAQRRHDNLGDGTQDKVFAPQIKQAYSLLNTSLRRETAASISRR